MRHPPVIQNKLRRRDPRELTVRQGGIAYLLEHDYGIELPRRLQIDFARHVQHHTDASGHEVTTHETGT